MPVYFVTFIQYPYALFACIPNFSQAVIKIFYCLSIDKEEITVLFPRYWITCTQIGPAQNITTEFIPRMKSGSHICISVEVKLSSTGTVPGGFTGTIKSVALRQLTSGDVTQVWVMIKLLDVSFRSIVIVALIKISNPFVLDDMMTAKVRW